MIRRLSGSARREHDTIRRGTEGGEKRHLVRLREAASVKTRLIPELTNRSAENLLQSEFERALARYLSRGHQDQWSNGRQRYLWIEIAVA
jgi:hypothetical protein